MAINYSTVITKEELELINPENYKNIRLICEAKRNELTSNSFFSNYNNMQQRAMEFAFSSKFIDMSYTEKILIAANILYFNNGTFINSLISKGITYKMLSTTINRMSHIKELALLKDEFELDEKTTISDKNINIICRTIRKLNPSYDNYNLTIAKLVEIVLFEKELYLSLEGGHQKTKVATSYYS